nr:MAG TPA: hypothetical protein [Crassvirales sp.]
MLCYLTDVYSVILYVSIKHGLYLHLLQALGTRGYIIFYFHSFNT